MPWRSASTIGKRVVPSVTAASGVWRLGEVGEARADGLWPATDQSVLLLPMDGTNGSTTFTDLSPLSQTVTASGTAAITTAESKYGGAAGDFDGSGYLTVGGTSDFKFLHDKTESYTIEAWIYPTSVTGRRAIVETAAASAESGVLLELNGDSLSLSIYRGVSGSLTTSSAGASSVTINTWQHISASVTTSDIKLFVDGVLKVTTSWSLAGSSASHQTTLTIGADNISVVGNFAGYIDDLRILRGEALYDTTFTPPGALT